MKKKSEIFINNVLFLLKGRGIVLQTEKELGLYPGYFSRRKDGKNINLSIALEVAEKLEYTIEELCDPNLEKILQLNSIDIMMDQLNKKKELLMEEIE